MTEAENPGDWEATALMLGPSRVGKTTLLTAVVEDSRRVLEGTPIQFAPADEVTRQRILQNANQLKAAIAYGEFETETLRGTTGLSRYKMWLTAGDDLPKMGVTFVDFPGQWIHSARGEEQAEEFANHVQPALRTARILVVPIDATLLMESSTPADRVAALQLLEVSSVHAAAVEWAKSSKGRVSKPALMLVPVKCESYFADNGGRKDEGGKLSAEVRRVYGDLADAVVKDNPNVEIIYSPVDTLGMVEVERVDWIIRDGVREPHVTYLVRGGSKQAPARKVLGANAVLAAVLEPLTHDFKKRSQESREEAEEKAKRWKTELTKDRPWYEKAWDWIQGSQGMRAEHLKDAKNELKSASERFEELTEAVGRLARERRSDRSEIWP